jgi:hypothetical protein
MELEEHNLEELRQLQSPADIVEAVLGLSRHNQGKVMVYLARPDSLDEGIWYHPLAAQEEKDNPESHGNVRVKLQDDITAEGYRIQAVEPLEVDDMDPLKWQRAREKFGQGKGYAPDMWGGYAGRLVKVPEK